MKARSGIWRFADGGAWDFAERTRVVGILNITPDSFSDGGRYMDPRAAVDRAVEIAAEGADAVDVGGESTRPGSLPVPAEEQVRRIVPVIRALKERFDKDAIDEHEVPRHDESSASRARGEAPTFGPRLRSVRADRLRISVDTTRVDVAHAAIEAGADIVNDVSGLRDDPAMAPLLSRARAAVILMHMRGTPRTMQNEAAYGDVIFEIATELRRSWDLARTAGVEDDKIVLDPGIGFAKTVDHNLEILAHLQRLSSLGRPLLVGVSRKSFLGTLTGLPVGERIEASLAAGAAAALNGASLLRVHDVAATVRMLRVLDAIRRACRPGCADEEDSGTGTMWGTLARLHAAGDEK